LANRLMVATGSTIYLGVRCSWCLEFWTWHV